VTAKRFMAAYVIGEKRLPWPKDLIPLLEDQSDEVRQAARRSLVILSFLELNPEEAAVIAAPAPSRPPTPLAKLHKPVDFGPAAGAGKPTRKTAVTKWTDWWAKRELAAERVAYSTTSSLRSSHADTARLADALLKATPDGRTELVAKYRDAKGVQYTEALAVAIARLPAAGRDEPRAALADRMVRMTDLTLRRYLDDQLAEIRRAAALGLAKRKTKADLDRLADLLLDPEPLVGQAAHTALCQLSGQDFGPGIDADEAGRAEAVERWKKWGQGKR
jgi:HEAT repeat protein